MGFSSKGFPSYKGSDIFESSDFPLAVRDTIHPASFYAHTHEFAEMVCVSGGQGMHSLTRSGGGAAFSCGIMHGDVFILKPGDAHSFVCCKGLRLYNVVFMPELVACESPELKALPGLGSLFSDGPCRFKLSLPIDVRKDFERRIKELAAELSLKLPGYRLLAKANLVELLALAGRLSPEETKSRDSSEAALSRQQAVNRAICHMERNLSGDLSLEGIAAEVRFSPSYLSHVFKEMTGLSPWSYLLRLRVERAKELLSSASGSIDEVALRSGFCDSSHMARTFKRVDGSSPKAHRAKTGRNPR